MDELAPHLSVHLRHRVGALNIDAAFQLTHPWAILFGPSGSGKTTILRAIAGLTRADFGRIVYRTAVLMDSSTGTFLPPHQRPVRLSAQTSGLFPHLTVQQNLLFGAGWPSKPLDQIQIANEIMALFRVEGLVARKPRQLSGGEQQRIAVARALMSATTYDGLVRPVLLLDEPFSGLETKLRDELLRDLQAWVVCWKIPVLSVTHDIAEAFQLDAEIIKLSDGRIVQQGPAATVLADERARLLEQLTPVE